MTPSDGSSKNKSCESQRSSGSGGDSESSLFAMSELLSLLGHELRTPLAGTMGMLELVLGGDLDEHQRGALELANASARVMLRLVEDLHDLARLEAGRLEPENTPFEVEAWARRIEQEFAGSGTFGLSCEIDAQVPEILVGDGERVAHLVLNLVDLFIKQNRCRHVALHLALASMADSNYLLVTIGEPGVRFGGKDRDALLRICGAARRVPMTEFRQVGLKQAISFNLAASFGGALWPASGGESRKIRALAVPVGLPAEMAAAGAETMVCEEPPRMERERSKAHILLVEDDDAIRKLVELLLQQHGWQVTAVSDGLQALESFQKSHFDLVLMDIRMPRLDGLEATRRIRRREQTLGTTPLPIIGMTAHAADQDRSLCLEAGMNDHLSKPIASNRLYAVIEKCLASHD